MKKIILTLAAALVTFCGTAQNQQDEATRMQKEILKTFHKRDLSQQPPKSHIPMASQATKQSSDQTIKSLPGDRVWFPGEWEEVQAIVVTPSYSYKVPGHENSYYWYADPLVTGYADYYQYSSGWQHRGTGPYSSVMDTVSAHGKVFFYLMDGIQLGGAEAWVHIEHPKDSAIVLRTLARMGLRHDNVRFIIGAGNSFWYRDCGPIAFYYGDQDSLAMLDFTYYPGRALDDSLPSLIHQQMGIPNYMTKVFWEGGNCLVDGAGMLFTSDGVYTANNTSRGQFTWDGHDINTLAYSRRDPMNAAQTKEAFRQLLGQRATYILPRYRYDGGTGHVDLYADAWDENGFVFSVMPDRYSSWVDYSTGQQNIDSLCSYKSLFDRNYYTMATLPFPSRDDGSDFVSQGEYTSDYTRTYSNHTFVNNVILQPCFSEVVNGKPTAAWDRANLEAVAAAYPGYTIYPVDVNTFDGSGGAIHCVTKQIPADNPIRILHKNIHGIMTAGLGNSNLPVSAIITNRSGIAHAEVMYRVNGGEWQTLELTANGNRWHGQFPFAEINTTVDSVDYYISATSNNGKTITKPMTANQGGYYHFAFGTDELFDSTWFDFDTTPMPMENITFVFGSNWATEDNNDPRPVGIDDVESLDDNFGQFYPNPATDQANLQINLGNGQNFTVTIIDNSGRTVHTSSLQAAGQIIYTVNASRLAAGIYNVVFSDNGTRVVRRLIVK